MQKLRDVVFHYKREPASPKEIEALEVVLNVKLPEDYRRFLLTDNGGWSPKYDKFPIFWGDKSRFPWATQEGYIEGIVTAEEALQNFQSNLEDYADEEDDYYFPINSLELENNEAGRIFLRLQGDCKHKVYFWPADIVDDIYGMESGYLDKIKKQGRLLEEFGGLVAESFSDFLGSLLTKYEDAALFFSSFHTANSLDSCYDTMQACKEKGRYKWLTSKQIEISFYHILLKDFKQAEEKFKEMLKGIAEHQIEPDTYLDWRNWSDYVELAQKEMKTGMKDWRFRFARRLHGVDPDKQPLLVPEGHDYSEILEYRDQWITGD